MPRQQGKRGTQLRVALRGWATATHVPSHLTGASGAQLSFAVVLQQVLLAACLDAALPYACTHRPLGTLVRTPAQSRPEGASPQVGPGLRYPVALPGGSPEAGGREHPYWLLCNSSRCGDGSSVGLAQSPSVGGGA